MAQTRYLCMLGRPNGNALFKMPCRYFCDRISEVMLDLKNNADSNYSHKVVKPGNVSPAREVPKHISVPKYGVSVFSMLRSIERKSESEVRKMRESCALARKILDSVGQNLKIGMTTDEVDRFTHELIIAHEAYPSPLFYRGFPKSVCTSVNNVACHGIPDDRPLEDGDIINIDITVFYKGVHGDCSSTFEVGNVDVNGKTLIQAARQCRDEAIDACAPGRDFSIIGKTVSSVAQRFGFKVMPMFCGHGIGRYFHGLPDIYHFDNNFEGTMDVGMTFTIEPVISEGSEQADILGDGWTAVTVDNSRTAQFEHTILITEGGVEILTK